MFTNDTSVIQEGSDGELMVATAVLGLQLGMRAMVTNRDDYIGLAVWYDESEGGDLWLCVRAPSLNDRGEEQTLYPFAKLDPAVRNNGKTFQQIIDNLDFMEGIDDMDLDDLFSQEDDD